MQVLEDEIISKYKKTIAFPLTVIINILKIQF